MFLWEDSFFSEKTLLQREDSLFSLFSLFSLLFLILFLKAPTTKKMLTVDLPDFQMFEAFLNEWLTEIT